MKKENKIIVVVSADQDLRHIMLQHLAVELGFAQTRGDAGKLIRQSPHDYDLANCYFVLAANYNLRESPVTTQRLFELAARGLAVLVGCRRIPPEMEFLCTAYYPQDFTRL